MHHHSSTDSTTDASTGQSMHYDSRTDSRTESRTESVRHDASAHLLREAVPMSQNMGLASFGLDGGYAGTGSTFALNWNPWERSGAPRERSGAPRGELGCDRGRTGRRQRTSTWCDL